MGILQGFLATIRQWDRPSQLALAIAVSLLVIALIILSTVPALRTPASIGFVGLMIVIQGIMLWGNRLLVTPYTQAQRHFLSGDFEQTVNVLQAHITDLEHTDKVADVDVWVLLGNTYRNLGQLDASHKALTAALTQAPNYHFALYGMGKTNLASGRYQEAIEAIQRALEAGAPAITRFDLAHAQWRSGNTDVALNYLNELDLADEPYRHLLAQYMRHIAKQASAPAPDLIASGLPFWEAEVERTQHTSYGQDLASDVAVLREML